MKIRSKMWLRLFVTFTALQLGASAVQADVLYSENFDSEGGAGAYDDGTTLEAGVMTSLLSEPAPVETTDLFSVNFYAYGALDSTDYDAVTLEANETAGVGAYSMSGWENILVPWGLSSPQDAVTITSANGLSAAFTFNDVRNGGPYEWTSPHTGLPGDGNGDLMDGHANGTEDPYDGSMLFDMSLSDMPYGAYDLIVYLGGNAAQFGDGTGKIVLNDGPEQGFTLPSGEFSAFTEIVNATTPGNYIVFTGVTNRTMNLKVWGNGSNHLGPTGFQIYVPDTSVGAPEGDLLAALAKLQSHVEGSNTLTDTELDAHRAVIDRDKVLFGTSENVMTAAFELSDAYETIVGPLFVNAKTRGGFDKVDQAGDGFKLERAIITVQQLLLDRAFDDENCQSKHAFLAGKMFETSGFFPGACAPPSDPQVSYSVDVNANNPTMWGKPVGYGPVAARRPTGCYLAPGSIGEVTVPAAMVNQGCEILVGTHTVDKSVYYKPTYQRLDRVTKSFPINSTVTRFANPLGGSVYIMIPYEAMLGTQTVHIKNVVKSPYYSSTSLRETTLQEWVNTERNHPGPWADFETDKFMMTVPTSWIYNYADPVTQMADWDKAMDAVSDLLGYRSPHNVHNLPLLYVQPDVSIQHTAYGVGNPQINWPFNPNDPTDGNKNHFWLRDVLGWSTEFHELCHSLLFSKFPGHEEAMVNWPYVYVANQYFGVDLVTANTDAMRLSYLENMSIDNTALTWFVAENFRNGNPMDISNTEYNEVKYQHRGWARLVDIADLLGWDVIRDFYYQEQLDYIAGTPSDGLTVVDSRIFRLSQAAGVDLTPLIHCWGVHPVNLSTLQAAITAEGLPKSAKVYDRLVHYKGIIPADNAEFWDHYVTIYPSQPEGGNPRYQYGWYNVWKDQYDADDGTAAKSAMQVIIDLYFPEGRPETLSDWTPAEITTAL